MITHNREITGISGATITFSGAIVSSGGAIGTVYRAIRNDVGARPASVALTYRRGVGRGDRTRSGQGSREIRPARKHFRGCRRAPVSAAG